MRFQELVNALLTQVAFSVASTIMRVDLRVGPCVTDALDIADEDLMIAFLVREVRKSLWRVPSFVAKIPIIVVLFICTHYKDQMRSRL